MWVLLDSASMSRNKRKGNILWLTDQKLTVRIKYSERLRISRGKASQTSGFHPLWILTVQRRKLLLLIYVIEENISAKRS